MKTQMKLSPIMTVEHCSGLSDDELKLMANTFGEKCQQAAKKTVEDAITAGTALLVMRDRIDRGEWSKWLAANWDYTRQTAHNYLTLAVNVKRFTNRTPDSIREAMRVIADQRADESDVDVVPRAERKTGRVEVAEVGQTVVQADHSVDVSKMVDENAVKAEPKTNTKHTPATAKAKEADRPAPMTITPVIIEEPPTVPDEPTLADWSVVELLTFLKSSADDPKKRARELRKAADELDPPTKFIKPTVEDVAEYCQQRKNNIDAEMFVAHYAANGWKLANGNKLNDWKSAVITWEKRNDSGSQQSGRAIAGTGRIKPGKIDESQIEWR
jgi:hypothetical protein